jgi:hypothetical protein
MPGLLDARGGFNDPITMGLLGASQALLTPMSQGGGLGAAFGAFPAAQQAAEQRRMRELMLQAQMGNMQSETEYRNAQMQASRQKAMRDAQIEAGRNSVYEQIAMQNMPTFRDASAAITGVNPTADYVAPQNRRLSLTPQLAAQAARFGIKPEELTAVFDAGLPEVARTIESIGANGSPVTQQIDKFGRRVGDGIAKPVEMKFLNTGGSQVAYDPFKGLTGLSIANTMTPNELAANALGRDRLNFDKREKWEVDKDRGIVVKPETGEARQITLNNKPVGAKEKDPNENQSNAALYAGRMKAANSVITELGNDPSVLGASINQSLTGTPLIGGALGGASNYFLSPQTKQYLQAQRDFINAVLRRESGAAIGEQEFDNARKQYFPQPGDDEATKQQKADARARAIAGIEVAAGPAQSKVGSISDTRSPNPSGPAQNAPSQQTGLGTQRVSGPVLGPRDAKQPAITPESVRHTARLYGISEDQVLQMLGAKR